MVSVRSPDNYFTLISVCFHEAKQKIQSSNLFWSWREALILPPPHKKNKQSSCKTKEGEQKLGWGNHLRWTGSHSFCILYLCAPPGLRIQTLQWRVTPVARSCCGFRKHKTVYALMGFVCLFSSPRLPSVMEVRSRMTSQKTQSDEDGSHLNLKSPRKPCG